ncbi:holin [Shewanella xiamenensis]|uniref:holin n=1 Tax=Shewanella xiamenensis TaxID=332186 RepID=UPI00217DB7CE|nr:holin [Shewanella xiamenensis]MCT8871348.1 hypothetical protein [Shewanella xiamenensis]UWH42862.1 hypothetical protein KXJ80_06275 [Shewanella xiamenensis]
MNSTESIREVGTQKMLAAASYSASATTAAGGVFTVNNLALWIGIFLTVLTFLVNWIYQAFKDRRDAERHELQTQVLKAQLKQVEQHNGPHSTPRDSACTAE